MRARKVDANSTDLYQAARRMGFKIYVNNDALCDAVSQLCGVTELWECKNGKRARFTDLQKKMREAGWQIRTVRSVDDLLLAHTEMTRAASMIQRARLWGTEKT